MEDNAVRRGIILAILAMAGFAVMDGFGKHLTGSYPVHQILWIRYAVFSGFVLAIAYRQGISRTIVTPNLRLQIVRSLLLVVESTTFITSFKFLPLADTHAIAASAPLMVTALAALLLHETVGPRRWGATLIGFVGVLVIIRPGLTVFQPISLLPVFAAALFAIYQILTRRLSGDSANTTLFYTGIIGFVALSFTVPFGWVWPTPADWLLLILVAILGIASHWLLILALRAAPASVLQPYSYTLVVFASFVGFVGFGDIPDAATIFGGLIVIGSGLYILHRENLRRGTR